MNVAIAPTRTRDRPVVSLAMIELGRILRHPAFIVFTGLSLLMHVVAYIEKASDRANMVYDTVANGPPFWVPAAVGLAIASGLAATRARRDDLVELMDTAPVTASTRTDAVILAVLGVGGLALLLIVLVMSLSGGWNGLPFLLTEERRTWLEYPIGTVLDSSDVTPSAAELLAGPAGLVTWGLLGVVAARCLGVRILMVVAPIVGFIQLIIVTWTPDTWTRWLWPLTHSAQYVGSLELAEDGTSVGIAQGFNVAAVGWHLLYLLGLAAILVAAARLRRGSGSASTALVGCGVVLLVTGLVLQVQVYTPDLHSP